ncbi:MAG: hypothetical protein ABIS69_04625 [Sediminibacterium sp.]
MTEKKIFELIDLIEDIKKVDSMIALHQRDDSPGIMLSQYHARKIKLTGNFIVALNSFSKNSAGSIFFIKRFLDKFYPGTPAISDSSDEVMKDLKRLEAAL